jgi:flagellar assembly protein FliH
MGLIKAGNAPVKAAVVFSMRDVEAQARELLARARGQAEGLIAAAQAEGEGLKKRMQAEGFAAGRQDGMAKGIEEGKKLGQQAALAEQKGQLTQAVNTLAAALKQVEGSRKKLESEALEEVVQLAVAVARRVTKRQGVLDEGVLVENLRESMKLVVHSADVRVAVHPAQRKVLAEAMPKLQLEWPVLEHAAIIDDETLAVGGCRVFTLHGRVDADLEGQLDRVVADLLPPRETDGGAA